MRVRQISLEGFRAWRRGAFAFDGRVTTLAGPNGSGKTSVLEAVWYLASLRSHRTASDEPLVRRGEERAILRARVSPGDEDRAQLVEAEIRPKGRAQARLGGAPVGRRRDILGILRAAIFAPERTAVVRGDPGERRAFADELLVQLHPRFHAVIRDYERALRQRNALLRDVAAGRTGAAGLDVWDEALAGPGGEIAAGRFEALAALTPAAAAAYQAVGGAALAVRYSPNIPEPEEPESAAAWTVALREALGRRRRDEVVRGVTLAGPHRDDVEVAIDGLPARSHASQGEAWMAACALVIGAHAAIQASAGEPPVLLLDDVFTPLDPRRRECLARVLPGGAQVLLTAADPNEVPRALEAEQLAVDARGS